MTQQTDAVRVVRFPAGDLSQPVDFPLVLGREQAEQPGEEERDQGRDQQADDSEQERDRQDDPRGHES